MRETIVIFPVHNAEKHIIRLINDFKMTMPSGEYIIIDDGSTDKTVDICREKDYNIISHTSHYGLETAVETGYKFALEHGYKHIIRIDGSGFYSAKDIELIQQCFNDKFDIVIGKRFETKKDLNLSQKIHSGLMQSYNHKDIIDPTTGFSAATLRIIRNLIASGNQTLTTSFISEQINDGFTIKEVPVLYSEKYKNKYFNKNNLLGSIAHVFAHKFLEINRKKGGK